MLATAASAVAGTPTWFPLAPFPNATDPFVPRVAESAGGDTLFAWVNKDGSGSHAMSIASLPAGPGAPSILSDTRGGNLSDAGFYPPGIALSATGDALVAWKEGAHAVGMRVRQAPGDFGDTQVKTTQNGAPPLHNTIESAIAVNGDAHGAFTVAYGEELPIPYSGSNNVDRIVVWNVDASTGLTTGPTFVGSTDTPGTTYPITDVALAVASDGSAVLAYRQYGAGMNYLEASTRSGPAGSWSSPFVLDFSGDQPRVAAEPGGRALVAWRHLPETLGDTFQVRAQFAPSSASGFAPVGTDALGTLSDANLASGESNVALDAAGQGLVVWQTCTGCSYREVKTQAITATGQLDGTIQTLSGQSPDPEFMNPQVAMTPSGGAVVAWRRVVSGHAVLEYARRDGPGVPFGPAAPVPADPEVALPVLAVDGGPELAVDNGGDAAVAWEQSTGTGVEIPHLARLDATPPAAGPIGLTGTPALFVPLTFTLSPRDTVSPTTVRWSFGDGASATGATVRHIFTAPGARTVTATVTDAAGYTTTATRVIPLPGSSAPRFLGGVSLSPSKLRHSRKPLKIQLRWTLSGAATVRVTITRSQRGRLSRGRCSLRARSGRRCTVTVTSFNRKIAAKAGTTSTRLTLPGLAPGQYAITVRASNSAGGSSTTRLTLTVTR